MRRRQFYEKTANVALSKGFVCKGVNSAIIGAIVGIVVSFFVNVTLVEIGMSPFFAMYFGILFFTVGFVMLWRVGSMHYTEDEKSRKKIQMLFCWMVVLSGLLCFVLKRNWFVGLNVFLKVPVYTLLGVSIAFAMTFSVVDFINYTAGFFQSSLAKSVIDTETQVFMVVCTAIVMGGIYGFIFGVMDIEDVVTYHVQLALKKEQRYCYPIGALLGAFAGFSNEYLRYMEVARIKMTHTEFDEEI